MIMSDGRVAKNAVYCPKMSEYVWGGAKAGFPGETELSWIWNECVAESLTLLGEPVRLGLPYDA